MRGIERKSARLNLRQNGAVLWAGKMLRKQNVLALLLPIHLSIIPCPCKWVGVLRGWIQPMHRHITITKFQGSFDRIRQARTCRLDLVFVLWMADDQAIHHGFNSVDFIAVHLDVFIQLVHPTIHPGTHKASFTDFLKHSLVSPFSSAHQWRQDEQAGLTWHGFNLIHDLLCRLAGHFAAAFRTVRNASAREKQAQVIVYLGNRAYR